MPADPSALASLRMPDPPHVGECSALLYSFMFYYLEVVMFLLLVTAAGLILVVLSIAVQCLPATCCVGCMSKVREWATCSCQCCKPKEQKPKKMSWLQSITAQQKQQQKQALP